MQPANRTIAKIWCERLKATLSGIHFRTSQHEESWATQRPQMNGYTMRQVTTTPNWQQKWISVEQWATRSGVQFETTCHAIRWKHQSWHAWQWMQQQNTQIWHTIVMTTWHLRSRMGVHIVLAEPASQLELNIAKCRRSWLGNRWNPSTKQINKNTLSNKLIPSEHIRVCQIRYTVMIWAITSKTHIMVTPQLSRPQQHNERYQESNTNASGNPSSQD